MKKEELILSVLSIGDKLKYTPVQIQKLFFLIDKRIGESIGGPYFEFKPYHYGPFDKSLYQILDDLQDKGLVEINNIGGLKKYSLTEEGYEAGESLHEKFKEKEAAFIEKLSDYVTGVSFSELVSSIYKEYPEMKANSIFTD
ncbi:hypothetical protein V1387_00755 [Allomuricauda taeanensis]|uniref:hypothetical protein n=1 Tax=Flagellimonas taeanensis TaxID=1005926 RepID=UPI002E7AE6C8|nr:hypothetical protein [Allomuricauda taeanensis]MEE1961192.1 hypothetical protein [Allomuricauda taeanensis]